MTTGDSWESLLAAVAHSPNTDDALQLIVESAMTLTRSRHALLAVLNRTHGHLEIQFASGSDLSVIGEVHHLPVDVGKADGIVGFVAATGSSVMTGNVEREPHYRKLFETTRSEMALPVLDRHGRLRAVLNVESDIRDAYADADRQGIGALASLAGMVLERARFEARELALIEIGTSLDWARTEDTLIQRVIRVAEEVLRLQACSIFLLDDRTDEFVLRATIGSLKDRVGEIGYRRGEGFTGWVGASGEPIMLDDPQEDPRWRSKYVEFPSEEIASFLAVPIVSRNRSIGVIRVLRRKPKNPYLDVRFDVDDLRLLTAIAEQIAVGLENLRHLDRALRSERMIAWGELSAKSSHMIGNRVFALRGDVNELRHLLAEPLPNLGEIDKIQESLAVNVSRIDEILQDFRDFVTATQLDRKPVDLNEIVRETVAEVFPRRTEVRLEMQLDELPPISLDAKKIRRAISELIENSLNHTDKGRLRVGTRSIPGEHPRIEIEIEDNGPGVDADLKALIFQPFFSKRVKGMGLGLSIVKGIVDAHGGTVVEAGEVGTGAKFVISLPL